MTRGKGGPVRAAVDPRYCLVRFMKRKEVLKRKAEALATRCAVDVAVLCTGPGGRGDLDCWPSKEAANEVARRYGALDPAQRAKHTEDHAADVARRLAEERDKLARAREGGVAGALGSWDGSLEAVSEGRLLELLASIEGSLVATKNRVLELQAPLGAAADRATFLSVLVHDEDTVGIFVPPRPQPRGEADAGGGGLPHLLVKTPTRPMPRMPGTRCRYSSRRATPTPTPSGCGVLLMVSRKGPSRTTPRRTAPGSSTSAWAGS